MSRPISGLPDGRRSSVIQEAYGTTCLYSTELEAGKRLALQEEKQALEVKLLEVPKLRARLADLKEVRSPVA